ncbi:VOC family protein [Methylobacterium sp. Leaf117]|uniref:VOC family protein n=1 Tax=Methylobacterium sp. Leaf117 TaxID=1736260 RepID=UPI0006F2C05B|nr:VOC family protein [Methylobacterium sp. Leaf117]KQP91159.1 glyoxalase [Methylobacterium sp. Leaf117]
MEPRLSLITLGFVDLGRATAFYEELGWPRRVQFAQGVAFFQLGGLGLSLYPRADLAKDAGVALGNRPSQGFTLTYNTHSRDEVGKVLTQAEVLGERIIRHGQDAVWRGHHGHFCDLDGFLWEVAWNPDFIIGNDGCLILLA